MRSWLRCYLYFVLLILSGTSLADTPGALEKSMGGYAYPVTCSHPSDLNYCFDATKQDAEKKACAYALAVRSANYPTRSYNAEFSVTTLSNGVKRCQYTYKIEGVKTEYSDSDTLSSKNGLCPAQGSPPPRQVLVTRQGRWFPQELPSTRCFETCQYSNGQSFDVKHYTFTNGILSEFKEKLDSRLKSDQQFCNHEPEPIRGNDGEVTYESSCEDAVFTQICDFINWFRNDSEMPEAPQVEQKTLDVTYLKTDHVLIQDNANNLCFDPVEFSFFLPWSRTEVKQEISFGQMCHGIDSFGNFLRALYLLHAAFIIFRR